MAGPRWPIGEVIEIVSETDGDVMGWITKWTRRQWEARTDPDYDAPTTTFTTLKAAFKHVMTTY